MFKEELKTASCSEWVKRHKRALFYLNHLIISKQIAPAQADWLIKDIILDESGVCYESDSDADLCAFEVWCDIQEIPGYFYQSGKRMGD